MHLAQRIIGLFQYSTDDKAYDITIGGGRHMQIGMGPMVRGGAIKKLCTYHLFNEASYYLWSDKIEGEPKLPRSSDPASFGQRYNVWPAHDEVIQQPHIDQGQCLLQACRHRPVRSRRLGVP